MSTTIDPELLAAALAEVRTLRTEVPKDSQATDDSPAGRQACCPGDRNGYQQHRRRNEEACEASKRAAVAYHQAWRKSEEKGPHQTECGTYSGYVQHRKKGQDVLVKGAGGCGCLEAKAEYNSAYYAANRERINARRRSR